MRGLVVKPKREDVAAQVKRAAQSHSALRQRRHRQRIRSGRAVFRVELGVPTLSFISSGPACFLLVTSIKARSRSHSRDFWKNSSRLESYA